MESGGNSIVFAVFDLYGIVNMRKLLGHFHVISKLSLLMLLLVVSSPALSKVFYSKNEALALAFGKEAQVEMLPLFPDDEQIRTIEQLARVKMESPFFTFYTA